MKRRTKGRLREFERAEARKSLDTYRQERHPEPIPAVKKKKKVKVNSGRMILTVIVLVLIAVVGMSVKTVFDLRAEQADLKKENKGLLSEKAALKEELKNINDPEYVEEQARIQLKLIKPGEILYILEDKDHQEKNEHEEEN